MSCVGTEADNPYAEEGKTDVTSCKAHEGYIALDAQRLGSIQESSRSGRFGVSGSALTASSEFPVWLECVDWALDAEGNFAVQVVNFRGPCGVEWRAGAGIGGDGLRIELENADPGCAVAGCGNCIYDVRTEVFLDEAQRMSELPFTLARLPCDGVNGRDSEWMLPMGDRPEGTSCVPADPWAARSAADEGVGRADTLYAPCADTGNIDPEADLESLTDCSEGFECVEGRCLPPCSVDADCPLDGALTCDAGFCRLAAQ